MRKFYPFLFSLILAFPVLSNQSKFTGNWKGMGVASSYQVTGFDCNVAIHLEVSTEALSLKSRQYNCRGMSSGFGASSSDEINYEIEKDALYQNNIKVGEISDELIAFYASPLSSQIPYLTLTITQGKLIFRQSHGKLESERTIVAQLETINEN